MQHAYPEEHQRTYQCHSDGYHQQTHTQIAFGTQDLALRLVALSFGLTLDQAYGSFDHAPGFDNTDQSRHRDGADTDIASVAGEQRLRVGTLHTRHRAQHW